MTRPPFEVADVIRSAGTNFRQHAALSWPQSSKDCDVRVHILDVKTGKGIKDIEAFAYMPSNSQAEQKANTDVNGDACLNFMSPVKEAFFVGAYAERYRPIAAYGKFDSTPQDVTIQMRHVGWIKAFGTQALGH